MYNEEMKEMYYHFVTYFKRKKLGVILFYLEEMRKEKQYYNERDFVRTFLRLEKKVKQSKIPFKEEDDKEKMKANLSSFDSFK